MKKLDALAIDLGANSGRGIIGSFDGSKLVLDECHRFYHKAKFLGEHHVWDFAGIYGHVKVCIENALNNPDANIGTIGVDSWSQDYGLLDRENRLLGEVHTYRDLRTQGVAQQLHETFSEKQIYSLTGLTSHPICTLLQIMSMQEKQTDTLESAKTLLFISDLINFYLTGEKRCNTSVAALSLLYSPFSDSWCSEIIDRLDIPDILPQLVSPGETLGKLCDGMAGESNSGKVDVCAVTSHDTLSAFDFIPNQENRVVISSGTWSILGCKTSTPNVSDEGFSKGFINEPGYGNINFLLRNITGMWIAQEVLKEWKQEENYEVDFETLNIAVQKSSYMGCINVDEPQFALPGNMQKKIYEYLDKTGQSRPADKTEMYRAIVISLAFKYKQSVNWLQTILNKKFEAINIIGGGAKNVALNQITADICGVPVLAGPYEATAIGNILCQLITKSQVGGVGQAGEIIRASFDIKKYEPQTKVSLKDSFEKFNEL
jgi:rhamnulokinase